MPNFVEMPFVKYTSRYYQYWFTWQI